MNNNQLIIHQTEDVKVKIETHFKNEIVWSKNEVEIAKNYLSIR